MNQATWTNHHETRTLSTSFKNRSDRSSKRCAAVVLPKCEKLASASRSSPYSTYSKSLAFVFLLIMSLSFVQMAWSCDIVGASACPHKPDNDLKEENFEEYCNKYKQNLECVYKKYKGCDRKEKYVEAMESMIKGLRKKAKQIEKLCEIDIDVPDEPVKAVNTSQDVRSNGQSGKKNGDSKPASTGPPCRISSISPDCTPILTNVQFNPQWNGVMKQKWCNSATAYHNCIKTRLLNCVGVQYMESLAYYEKIEKYIHSQSNINCPGGLEGCVANPNDVRCKMGVKYGENNGASKTSISFFTLSLVSICIYFSSK